jgi:hypothetical protein
VQERLEGHGAGRGLISAFIVLVVFSVVVWNMSSSHLKDRALPVTKPFLITVGLDQAWNVFSPDPRRQVIDLIARIDYAGGGHGVWHIPTGHRGLGELRAYRWQKLLESEIADANKDLLWRPLAQWVARTHTGPGRRVVKVTLVRRWYDLSQAGVAQGRPHWHQFTYFTYQVPS